MRNMYNFAQILKAMSMNDELKKCLSGEWYDCHAPIFIEFKKKTNRLHLSLLSLRKRLTGCC